MKAIIITIQLAIFLSISLNAQSMDYLVHSSTGLYYGISEKGGTEGKGTVSSFDPMSGETTVILDFTGENGAFPSGELFEAQNGLIFGTTEYGGEGNHGVIFAFNPILEEVVFIISFDESSTGSHPQAGLMEASNGLLYGTCIKGGQSNDGTVFIFNPYNLALTGIAHLDGKRSGSMPMGDLIEMDGKLFGFASRGGLNNVGSIFELNPENYQISNVFDFEVESIGAYPNGSLEELSNGTIVGACMSGGLHNNGTIFSFSVESYKVSKLTDLEFKMMQTSAQLANQRTVNY